MAEMIFHLTFEHGLKNGAKNLLQDVLYVFRALDVVVVEDLLSNLLAWGSWWSFTLCHSVTVLIFVYPSMGHKVDSCNTDLHKLFYTPQNGYQAMITQHAWMFLSSYEKLREKILQKMIINMAHLGPRAFDEIGGEVVQTTSFVFQNNYISKYIGTYYRLVDFTSQHEKERLFTAKKGHYNMAVDKLKTIPGKPLAYWISMKAIETFNNNHVLSDVVSASVGIQTGNNDKFVHLWWEVLCLKICTNALV